MQARSWGSRRKTRSANRLARRAKASGPAIKRKGRINGRRKDVFLNHIRKNKVPVTIFLVNGVKLQGIVTWFDNFSVLLRRDAHSQLVYKHAISTVMPATPVQLFEPQAEAQNA